jgi:hypothetical protein
MKHVTNPSDMWVRSDGAFEPIVSHELFYMAQGIFMERSRRFSDEEMLKLLRSLVEQHSTISASLIDSTDEMPSSASYRYRFSSLVRAYQLAGYAPGRDYSFIEINRRLRQMQPRLVEDLIGKLGPVGALSAFDPKTGFLVVNDEYTAGVVLSRCRQTATGSLRWLIKIDDLAPDITVVARMDTANEQAVDYYLFPIMNVETPNLILCESNGVFFDSYKFDTLDYFVELAAREQIEAAA